MRCGFGVQKAQIMMVLIRRLHDKVSVPFHPALSLLTFQREKEMPYSSYKFTYLLKNMHFNKKKDTKRRYFRFSRLYWKGSR